VLPIVAIIIGVPIVVVVFINSALPVWEKKIIPVWENRSRTMEVEVAFNVRDMLVGEIVQCSSMHDGTFLDCTRGRADDASVHRFKVTYHTKPAEYVAWWDCKRNSTNEFDCRFLEQEK
jgi:hypothetical protein